MFRTFLIDPKIVWKQFSIMFAVAHFWLKQFWRFCLTFRKMNSTSLVKNVWKSQKNIFSNTHNIHSFEGFAFLSQKMILTYSLKSLQKQKKTNNATPNTSKFQNHFLKCSQWQSFDLSSFEGFFFFNCVTQKFTKDQNVLLWKAQNNRLWPKDRFKTIFENNPIDKLLTQTLLKACLRENLQIKAKIIIFKRSKHLFFTSS